MKTEKNDVRSFEDFGLRAEILEGIKEAGFRAPSPIQLQAIPAVMEGNDVIGRAQTGTGKTAAFGLPTMNKIGRKGGVEILVIVPTRELASQVSEELFRLGRFASVRTVAVYGGQSIGRQVEMINRGCQVVVATPGRLLDHLRSKRLKRFEPSMVVLDEADEMLDMGFLEDIEKIFNFLPEKRQTLLFSATMPPAIERLAKKILNDPKAIDVTPRESATATEITQRYCVMREREREDALVRLIDSESPKKAIVFCRTKKEADTLSTTLISRGYSAKALHGDMDQRGRNEAVESFRKGRIDLLVATDVAARGLDISDVSHVFNYHIPFDPQSYIHRIGRTGRAGREGIAITLLTPLEFKELSRIMKVSGAPISFSEIPTLKEMKRGKMESLLGRLEEQKVYDEAEELIAHIGHDEGLLADLACRAISALIERGRMSGPDRIGLGKEEAGRLFHQARRGGRPGTGGKKGWQKKQPGRQSGKGRSFSHGHGRGKSRP